MKKNEDELVSELSRIKKIMHFPSKEIGESLNMKVETPFLDNDVIDFSENIPISKRLTQKMENVLVNGFLENHLKMKYQIALYGERNHLCKMVQVRQNLTNLFNSIITDEIFTQKKTRILEEDGVYIRTKESLHYYECFRKSNSVKKSDSDNRCPDCNYEIEPNSRFCRMCGKFPIV